jgi:hypothetical protein
MAANAGCRMRPSRRGDFPMSRTIRSAALALVLATLVSAAAPALSFAGRPAPTRTEGLAAAWSWLASWLVPASPAANTPKPGIPAKAGSRMNPDEVHVVTIYPGSTTDAGSHMDPDGFK